MEGPKLRLRICLRSGGGCGVSLSTRSQSGVVSFLLAYISKISDGFYVQDAASIPDHIGMIQ